MKDLVSMVGALADDGQRNDEWTPWATWRVRDNFGVGLHWRADFRSDADPENQVGLSAAFRF
ncbi:MAG: hypothetical protein K9N23_22915 [Akkermansiaceae bacterium]|nr:hypothetical protein [Akkermansiaceae bacterium]